MRLLFTFVILIKFQYSYEEFEPYIVNGVRIPISDLPHAVCLAVYCSMPTMCGSSVLNQKILITAAHCIDGCSKYGKDRLDIFAGHEMFEKSTITRRVKSWRIHEKYDPNYSSYDIALFSLKQDLRLGANVLRVAIPQWFPNVEEAVVAGWGSDDDHIRAAIRYLKLATVALRSTSYCNNLHKLDATKFCAGSPDLDKAHPSWADSGSALLTLDLYTQIGIVSYRFPDYYGLVVYTNVSYFRNWITQASKELNCE